MRVFNLKANAPLSLTLAADARLTAPSYTDDQVWELSLQGGEPPALALHTTFGLRARSLRIFPRFVEGYEALTDPEKFVSPPVVRRFYTNYLEVGCYPFPDIEVVAEYWAYESNAIAGRLRFTNQGAVERQVRLEWITVLTPNEDGQRMAPLETEAAPALAGSSGGLAPVVFITGGALAVASPYPALVLGLELAAGQARQFLWSQAAQETPQASFELARHTVAHNWDAELARIELHNAAQVEIYTGDADWDVAFALAQKTALGLFVGPTPHLPHASFVSVRRPDYGYSLRGDGSDYGPLWNGQTALEAYYLISQILPAAPELAKGLLFNFLSTQTLEGVVDWKPGLGGQRGNRLATPLLASLAWNIYQTNEERAFLEQVYPQLFSFLLAWFSPDHDRDGDGIPEWDHAIQAGFEDHPLFSHWHPWSQGVDITTTESPAMCAFLYRECQVLIQIAKLVGRQESLTALEAFAENLRAAVEKAWDSSSASYRYWDRDVHTSPAGITLGERSGAGRIDIDQEFDLPLRLVLRLRSSGETTRRAQAFVHGSGPSGHHRVERIPATRFLWFPGYGTVTSERTYSAVEYVEVQGLDEGDQVAVLSAGLDCQDHTSLLPLWAGIPSEERARALVQVTITNPDRYWQPYGIPACPVSLCLPEAEVCQAVHLPWCALIGEGLVRYGYREVAAELVTRLMQAIIQTLKSEASFRQLYHAGTGQGLGERDVLGGLAPFGLFLETLGVRLISPLKVALEGFNPFPWPVTVKYRGLTVLRQKEKTQIIFPDGQAVAVEDPAPRVVSLE